MAIKRKLLKNFDFGLIIDVLLICGIGLVAVASATGAFTADGSSKLFVRQIIWIIIGLILMVLAAVIDYNTFKAYYKLIYIANVGLLCVLVVIGKVTMGANSWFGIGSLGGQPSELMKIALIVALAKKIEEFEGDVNNFKNLGIIFLYSVVPLGLIVAQPDLGSAMVLVAIIIGMLFMAGLDLRILLGGFGASIASVFVVFPFLKPHQQARLKTFIDPQASPLGDAYHITHSKIAIGSGMLFGMGFGKGLQNQGKFLPEGYTDFIFSVLGEEFGFVGVIILITLYALMIFKCLKITRIAKDTFGSMVVVGIVSMFTFQMFQNIGMTMELMPITGITLPFVSYGGSSMFASMIGIGLVLNIGMRRHKINF